MTREEAKQLNRQKILLAATKLMVDQGIRLTSMKAVSLEAGISIVTMYKYFPTKEKLSEAVVLEFYRDHFQPIVAAIEGTEATFTEIMTAFKRERQAAEDLLGQEIWHEFQQVIKQSKKVTDYLYDTQMSLMYTLIQKGRASGDINTPASDEVILMVFSWMLDQMGKLKTDLNPDQVAGLEAFFQYGLAGQPSFTTQSRLDG